jgi:hypothetical protein
MEPQVQNARAIAWALNRVQVVEANPDASRDDIFAAWQDNKFEMMNQGRKILASLEKQGFTITAPETVSEED